MNKQRETESKRCRSTIKEELDAVMISKPEWSQIYSVSLMDVTEP